MAYLTRDHQSGSPIDKLETETDAIEAVDRYVEEDKEDGIYTPRFYEVYDNETCEVVYIA